MRIRDSCTGIDSVIGNSTKFEGETEKEKLSQMKLPDMKATAEKLYEMFGINLPSDLSGEAEKYLDAYAVPTGTEAEGTVSPLKKDVTADELSLIHICPAFPCSRSEVSETEALMAADTKSRI